MVLALLLGGCMSFARVDLGPALGPDGVAVAVEAHYGQTITLADAPGGWDHTMILVGPALRLRFEDGYAMGALAPETCAALEGRTAVPMLCAGFHLLQFDGLEGDGPRFSLGSPYLMPTVAIPPGPDQILLSNNLFISLPVDYVLRYGAKDRWYVGLTVGVGPVFRTAPAGKACADCLRP